jgi:pre-mRNA-splicing factor SYF1
MTVDGSLAGMGAVDDLMPSDEDLLYEEELLRNPYSIKMWLRYLEAKTDAPAKRRYLLFERALKALPGSYKVRQSHAVLLLSINKGQLQSQEHGLEATILWSSHAR